MDQSSNTQKMETWNENRLLAFIQDNLQNPLTPADEKKLLDARIDGSAFLEGARDRTIFKEAVGLCANLNKLARTIVEAESVKGRFYLINLINATQTLILSYKWIPPVLKYSLRKLNIILVTHAHLRSILISFLFLTVIQSIIAKLTQHSRESPRRKTMCVRVKGMWNKF